MNSCCFVGNLTREPVLAGTPTGRKVCNMSLAINGKKKNGDTWEKETTYVDLIAWEHNATFAAQYLCKGQLVEVCGSLSEQRWKDRDNGEDRRRHVITVRSIQGLARVTE